MSEFDFFRSYADDLVYVATNVDRNIGGSIKWG